MAASRGVVSYLRRKVQIEDIYNGVKFANLFSFRSEPIIPGTEESDLESEFAESVHLVGDEEQEPQPVDRNPRVPWHDPQSAPPWRKPPEQGGNPPPGSTGSASSSAAAPIASSVVASGESRNSIIPKATGERPIFSRRVTISGGVSAKASVESGASDSSSRSSLPPLMDRRPSHEVTHRGPGTMHLHDQRSVTHHDAQRVLQMNQGQRSVVHHHVQHSQVNQDKRSFIHNQDQRVTQVNPRTEV